MKQHTGTPEPLVHFEQVKQRAIRLSNRQYGLLQSMVATRGILGLDDIAQLNQNTLGANKRRGWVTEKNNGHAIGITHEGRQVLRAFENADFLRKVASSKFAGCLNLEPPASFVKRLQRKRAEGAGLSLVTRKSNAA